MGKYLRFICDMEPGIKFSVATVMNLERIKGFVRFHKLCAYNPATCRNLAKVFNEICKWMIVQTKEEMVVHIPKIYILER